MRSFADKANRWAASDGSHLVFLIELNSPLSPDKTAYGVPSHFLTKAGYDCESACASAFLSF